MRYVLGRNRRGRIPYGFTATSHLAVTRTLARPWQRGFQDAGTPIAEGIIRFHHDLMVVMVMVATFVAWMMGRCVHHFEESKN